MNRPILQLHNVSHAFDDVQALKNITLSLHEAEFVTIVGQSGSGKTTLLRIMAGLIAPQNGTLTRHHADDGIGIVFQNHNLMPWRTVRNNVLLPLEIKGIANGARRAQELIELVGLFGFENSFPAQLSGGMAQRVALARALVHEPDLLLLDEPFGALDALTRERMGRELLKLHAAHPVTFFMVTHSIEEAILLSDRVLVLSARPGTLLDNIEITLPRPRDFDMRYTPKFQTIVAHIRSLISAD